MLLVRRHADLLEVFHEHPQEEDQSNGDHTLRANVQEDHLRHLTIVPAVIGLLARMPRELLLLPVGVPGRHHHRGIHRLVEDVLPLILLVIVQEMDDHLLAVSQPREHPLVDEQAVAQGQCHPRDEQNPHLLERTRDKLRTGHELHHQDEALREAEVFAIRMDPWEVVEALVQNRRRWAFETAIVAFRAREAVERVGIQSRIHYLMMIQTLSLLVEQRKGREIQEISLARIESDIEQGTAYTMASGAPYFGTAQTTPLTNPEQMVNGLLIQLKFESEVCPWPLRVMLVLCALAMLTTSTLPFFLGWSMSIADMIISINGYLFELLYHTS